MSSEESLCTDCPELRIYERCSPRLGLSVTTLAGTRIVVKCNWHDHILGLEPKTSGVE